MKESDSRLLDLLKNGDTHAIERIYMLYRAEFFSWARSRYISSPQDLEDAWQDAVIVFFENVKNGRLLVLNSSIKTYLFAVGKNILLNCLRKNSRIDLTDKHPEEPEDAQIPLEMDYSEEESELARHFERLGKKCKDLLIKKYYYGKPIDLIRQETGMNSNNVVSASLSRCLSRLRDLIKGKNISDGK